ncbi:MAG: serine acetyltransferase, partial [Austwickia sp.]|nr:serine acetyltransferase [Austwickia sp.]
MRWPTFGARSADALSTPKTASVRDAMAEARTLLAADFPKNPYPMQRVTLVIWRAGQALCGRRGLGAFVLRRVVQILDGIWIRGLIGAELPTQVVCGPGVRIPHAARGVIIHPSCVIGSRVVIYHGVTLGMSRVLPGPRVEDDVFLGSGAQVIGPITVRRGTRVGAGAVVVKDTEPDTTYVGVP